jgi:hypothetical protein
MERLRLEQEAASGEALNSDLEVTIRKIVELAQSGETLYEVADPLQKRQLLEIVMSNCTASGKTLEFSLREPFATLANRDSAETGGQLYYTPRTFPVEALISFASTFSEELSDVLQSIKLAAGVKAAFPEPLI